ncbi:MAG: hypothetical protein RL134_1859 [Actinomycetota bacterium]
MSEGPEAPPYGSATLADVLPSAASVLGVPGFTDVVGITRLAGGAAERPPAAVTVLLVDGLGWWPWQHHRDSTPTLAAMSHRRLSTTVPSTTPTALASLGTGLPPGAHGIVGAAFRLPEDGEILHPLSWTDGPHPLAVQPEPTVFERVAREGFPVVRIGASAYAQSGLTQAVLRGGEYAGSDNHGAIGDAVVGQRRGLGYAYVSELDRMGHVYGVASLQWRDALVAVETLVARIIDRIDDDHLLVVTADHGMVDCPPSSRVIVEGLPGFDTVITVAGEPRLRHVYCAPGSAEALTSSWRDHLAERAYVLDREEAVARGLFGPTDEDYAERVGDVVVLARGDTILVSEVDPLVSGLLGQHGSVTEAEMHIPLLAAWGAGRG